MTHIFGKERGKKKKKNHKTIQPVAPDGQYVLLGYSIKWIAQKTLGYAEKKGGKRESSSVSRQNKDHREMKDHNFVFHIATADQ
jgi:hypothetical protein